jgi:protein tyrosine phosphatase (PTP) superfamily phosphohydrolase (DUF442 family)
LNEGAELRLKEKQDLAPTALGTIRNFAWVVPGALARGEQPELDPGVFAMLRETGVSAVLSLRPDREPPSPNARRPWPEYHVEDEHAVAEAAGLRFANVGLADFSAPSPEQVACALKTIDTLADEGHAVYVHCRAGAGRAGLISGAWGVTRGLTGDDAADNYVRFMAHIGDSLNLTDEQWAAFARRVGQPYVWWALREVVAALGSPITREQPRLLAAEKPPNADHWEDGYRALLQPWRKP